MQLKYSFKKEWSHFSRTFRLLGVILAIVGFAVANPMIFRFMAVLLDQVAGGDPTTSTASFAALQFVSQAGGVNGGLSGADIEQAMALYSDAAVMFSVTLSSFASYGLLIIMLILMSAAGGEQKKRAMIVPMCSGLENKNYLIPKFVIYPLVTFAVTFLSALIACGLCNYAFKNNKVAADGMFLSALAISVYMVFIVCVFLSLGLCTSRPGVAVPCIFLGQMLIESLMNRLGLLRYHPFALLSYIGSGVMTDPEFDFGVEAPSFIISIAISLVVCVLMYFLALGVLKAKKINNQEEKAPEF